MIMKILEQCTGKILGSGCYSIIFDKMEKNKTLTPALLNRDVTDSPGILRDNSGIMILSAFKSIHDTHTCRSFFFR